MNAISPQSPEGGDIQDISIVAEMRQSYLDYAMSVIVERSLPDACDGMKPVHRRIMYAMLHGYDWTQPYKKSARIVGDVMGKYHPHGDSAIYDAMVRLAQGFSMRLPLVDGQGNFGSIDGDPPAAMRYTEARLAKIAEYLLTDIDKDTVEWQPNYDESTMEPMVLPARLPNLLVNGVQGIAVGFATNIPPHHPGSVVEALLRLIDEPTVSDGTLIDIVGAPDFPTGGLIIGRKGVLNAYVSGQGAITMRARTDIEVHGKGQDRQRIIVTELPYQVNKAKLLERIAELVNEKVISGISDLRDESDREGMRVVIELKKDAVADTVLAQLFKFTPLQINFPANMMALVGGQPELLTLRRALEVFVDFRRNVVRRRTVFELKELRKRAEVLAGYLMAIGRTTLDRVIATIRAAKNPQEAREALRALTFTPADMAGYYDTVLALYAGAEGGHLTEQQADEILKLRLQRLTGLERGKIEEEARAVIARMRELAEILRDDVKLVAVVRQELADLPVRDLPRRTEVVEGDDGEIDIADLIPVSQQVVTITRAGYVKRVALDAYRVQNRGGKGKSGANLHEDDAVTSVFTASSHDRLLVVTNSGRAFTCPVYKLPEGNPQTKGRALVNLFPVPAGESVAAVVVVPPLSEAVPDEPDSEVAEDEGEAQLAEGERTIVFATSVGTIRRNPISVFDRVRASGKIAMKFEGEHAGVRLVSGLVVEPDQDILLTTKLGRCIRVPVADIPVKKSNTSIGVRGIRLGLGDEVVAMSVLKNGDFTTEERAAYLVLRNVEDVEEGGDGEQTLDAEAQAKRDAKLAAARAALTPERQAAMEALDQVLITVTENGFGKRSLAFGYRQQGRGGSGMACVGKSLKLGMVVDAFVVDDNDEVVLATNAGQMIRIKAAEVRLTARNANGVRLFNVAAGEKVVSASRVPVEDGEE